MAGSLELRQDEWEICNEDGFVYKRRKRAEPTAEGRLLPGGANAVGEHELRKRWRALTKHCLLALRGKYTAEIRLWESLSSAILDAPLPLLAASDPAASSPAPHSSSPCSLHRRLVDGLLAQAETQESALQKLSELCDVVESICEEREQELVQSLIDLPVWGSPRSLMNSLSN